MRALLANETVTFDGDVRAPRRRRARLRVPGAPAQGRAHLHRRHRHADDGADRRDRRRRRAQLPRLARLQRARRMEHLAVGAEPGPGARVDDIDRPQLVVCSVHEDRADRARHGPPDGHAVPRPAAPHHEGVGRAAVAARRASARCSPGRPPTSRWRRRRSSCPTRSCRCSPRRARPTRPGPRWPSTSRAGCTCPILYPLGDVRAMIDAFAGWSAPGSRSAPG